jgi:hypothetical protein
MFKALKNCQGGILKCQKRKKKLKNNNKFAGGK